MARYIDADRLNKDVLASWDKDKHVTLEASRVHRQEHHHLMRITKKQPTADVVKVVRCKDCKHRGTDDCPMYHEEYIAWDDDGCLERDIIIHDATESNSFCSHGERKSDENNS